MTDTSHTKYILANIFISSTYLPRSPPRARGCKNYPCSITLRADWKINRDHRARLVSSNRDWFAYYTNILIILHTFFTLHTRGRLQCLLGFCPLGQNPAGAIISPSITRTMLVNLWQLKTISAVVSAKHWNYLSHYKSVDSVAVARRRCFWNFQSLVALLCFVLFHVTSIIKFDLTVWVETWK